MFLQLMDVIDTWQGKIVNAVDKLLVPILIIACSVGVIWAVVIGIKMMKAEDKNARDENKARLINIAISIVSVIILIGLFYALRNWLLDNSNNAKGELEGLFKSANVGGTLANTFNLAKQCVSMIL